MLLLQLQLSDVRFIVIHGLSEISVHLVDIFVVLQGHGHQFFDYNLQVLVAALTDTLISYQSSESGCRPSIGRKPRIVSAWFSRALV